MAQRDGATALDAAAVDSAIAQVLHSESKARDDVQRCARDAETLVEQAHERARQIARRAAHRSVRVQQWSAAALARQLGALAERQAQIERIARQVDAPDALKQAVGQLAAQLTGATR